MPFTMGDSAIRWRCLLTTALLLCSCDRVPDFYPTPAQRPAFDDPHRWERIVHMTDADAQEHFVADVFDPLAANWRWTGRRPLIRLKAPAQASLRYHIQFAITPQTFQTTGPVVLTFLVNGRSLDRAPYAAAGEYIFEKDIPADWITGGETILGAEIDKLFLEKDSGKTYGFLLISLGLKRRGLPKE
jgi:hypothetical protein